MSTFIFTENAYPLEDIPLGTIVSDLQDPLLQAKSPSDADVRVGENDVSTTVDTNFESRLNKHSESGFQAALTYIFRVVLQGSHQYGSSESLSVWAGEARYYRLRKPNELLNALCAQKEIKQHLELCHMRRNKAYLIVGLRTLLNARVLRDKQNATNGNAQASFSSSLPPASSAGLSSNHGADSSSFAGANLGGERVYAIEYRKVNIEIVPSTETPAEASEDGSTEDDIVTGEIDGPSIWKETLGMRGKPGTGPARIAKAFLDMADEAGWGEQEVFEEDGGRIVFVRLNKGENPLGTNVAQDDDSTSSDSD